jgi:hypothetical protein
MKEAWKSWGRTVVLWGLAGFALGVVLSLPVPREYIHKPTANSADYQNEGGVQITVLVALFDWVGRNRDGFDVIFACLVAYFTYILASKTAGLFVETAGLRAAAEQQKADLLRSIEATEKAAEATVLSAKAGEEAAALAREEFNSTHRAKIIVRHAHMAGEVTLGEKLICTMWCINIGDTIAYNVRPLGKIFYYTPGKLPLLIVEGEPYETFPAGDFSKEIEPSRFVAAWFESEPILDQNAIQAISNGTLKVYFMGKVFYNNALGVIRVTGFCRVYDANTRRFVVMDNDEYEYQY